jgi:hypothetical protein
MAFCMAFCMRRKSRKCAILIKVRESKEMLMNQFGLSRVKGKTAFVIALCLMFGGLLWLAVASGATVYATGGLQSAPVVPVLTATPTDTDTDTPAPALTPSSTSSIVVPTYTATPVPPTATPACSTYSAALTTGATIVPGTTDTGNHCNSCGTDIILPFPVTLYGQTFNAAQVGSNGYLAFGTPDNSSNIPCYPSDRYLTYSILPFWAFQATDAPGKGIYTLVSGTAPDRTFYVEWRNCVTLYGSTCITDGDTSYEVIFPEGQNSFQVVYGTMGSATADKGVRGVVENNSLYTQASCNTGASAGDRLTYTPIGASCPTGTPTPSATSTSTDTPTPYPTPPSCAPGWRVTPRGGSGQVSSVYVTASGDAWAAGDDGILHWNGTQWVTVGPTGGYDHLQVVGPNDAWGISNDVSGTGIIGHWNGTSWSVSPYPPPQSWFNSFSNLAAWSPTDIWVVGYSQFAYRRYVILHWDGTSWHDEVGGPKARTISRDSPAGGGWDIINLDRVAAIGPGEMWSYGQESCYGYTGCHNGPVTSNFCLTDCHDGSIPTTDEIKGGALVTPSDRWVVAGTSIWHWNGSAWATQSHPDVGLLAAISASSTNDAWAAGSQGILHWNGSAWLLTPSTGGASKLASMRPNDAWAVRTTDLLHYPSFQLFSDVPPSNTYFTYIGEMACRQIISGYASGCETGNPCFRPSNPVSRGQVAKIVSNSAGFNDAQTTQIFEDVPVGSTFQVYVGRLSSRGFISGYPCGSPGDPCVPPANLPYFRPNNPVTRGQLAKIVANAAGLNDPPGAQVFEDVPVGSLFYDYIQRLTSHGYMSGYPCGSPGDPCVPPANRPYFRPNNGATRGQTAKIVTNTFFSGDQSPPR